MCVCVGGGVHSYVPVYDCWVGLGGGRCRKPRLCPPHTSVDECGDIQGLRMMASSNC